MLFFLCFKMTSHVNLQDQMVKMVMLDHLVKRAGLDHRVRPVLLDRLAHQDLLESKDLQVGSMQKAH